MLFDRKVLYLVRSQLLENLVEGSNIIIIMREQLSPTLEALVDSRWEGVSQHHHRGVDDDFSASALRSCHLALAPATIQFQHHFVVMPIKEDLVPLAVVEAIFGQG